MTQRPGEETPGFDLPEDSSTAGETTREAMRDPRGFLRKYGKRALVSIGGFALILGGAVMLVTPGPGWLAIIAGLALLASEFVWAERLYERAKKQGKAAYEMATASKMRIALSVTLTLVGIGAVIWVWIVYL